ncbi:MAG: ATP-binding cassette domain-containing protein [Gemmatimonadota bacterium]
MPEPAVITRELTCRLGDVRAVDGLSVEVPAGSIFGFLGPNGAGKTTTIRLLLGLLEPTRGGARVLGHDVRHDSAAIRRRAGVVLESHGLSENLPAIDNLEFAGRVWRIPPDERRERSRELLERLGLWERRSEPVGDWSRGMKQRLAYARAVFHRPDIVFLDEPTSGLDPVAAAELRSDLESLAREEGVTVFLTTHNLAEAERVCDEIAVIHRGNLRAAGSPDELRRRLRGHEIEIRATRLESGVVRSLEERTGTEVVSRGDERLRLRLADPEDVPVLIRHLVEAGVELEEVRQAPADLEEVFLSAVRDDGGGSAEDA